MANSAEQLGYTDSDVRDRDVSKDFILLQISMNTESKAVMASFHPDIEKRLAAAIKEGDEGKDAAERVLSMIDLLSKTLVASLITTTEKTIPDPAANVGN